MANPNEYDECACDNDNECTTECVCDRDCKIDNAESFGIIIAITQLTKIRG